MKSSILFRLLAVIGILALAQAACTFGGDTPAEPASDDTQGQSGGEDTSADSGQQPSGPPTATPFVYSGPQPAAGTGNVYGRLLWNGGPAVGVAVELCDEIEFFGGCKGQIYDTVTDENGVYLFMDVTPMTYGLTFQALESDDWMYLTSGILDARDFEVTADEVLAAGDFNIVKYDMAMIGPAADSRVSEPRPTLAWEPYPEAAYYDITFSPERGSSLLLFYELEETSITPTVDLLNCNYGWYVKAYNSQGIQISETDRIWHFDEIDQPYSCNVTGLSPADGAGVAGQNIVLSWDAHELAVYYQINMYNSDDSSLNILDFVRADSTSYTITQAVPPGTYTWVVYAYDQVDDFFAFSDTYTLVVTAP